MLLQFTLSISLASKYVFSATVKTTIIVNGGNVKEMPRIRRTILLLFTLIVIWNNVACNEIESFNEKSNATEEDCLDGACREIIDVNYTIDNTK